MVDKDIEKERNFKFVGRGGVCVCVLETNILLTIV